jgi:hypothetical protein
MFIYSRLVDPLEHDRFAAGPAWTAPSIGRARTPSTAGAAPGTHRYTARGPGHPVASDRSAAAQAQRPCAPAARGGELCQRFGSAMNVDVHSHFCVMAGVCTAGEDGWGAIAQTRTTSLSGRPPATTLLKKLSIHGEDERRLLDRQSGLVNDRNRPRAARCPEVANRPSTVVADRPALGISTGS